MAQLVSPLRINKKDGKDRICDLVDKVVEENAMQHKETQELE